MLTSPLPMALMVYLSLDGAPAGRSTFYPASFASLLLFYFYFYFYIFIYYLFIIGMAQNNTGKECSTQTAILTTDTKQLLAWVPKSKASHLYLFIHLYLFFFIFSLFFLCSLMAEINYIILQSHPRQQSYCLRIVNGHSLISRHHRT